MQEMRVCVGEQGEEPEGVSAMQEQVLEIGKKFTCDHCGKIFRSYPSLRRGNKKFCSARCYGLYQRLQLNAKPEDLAYVLGVYYGDGTVETSERGKRIVLFSVTPEFNGSFEKSLKVLGLNPSRNFSDRKPNWKRIYRTVCYSTELYNLINRLGFKRDIKVEELRKLIFNKTCFINFLRGFYESDGSHREHQLYMACTNRKLMEFLYGCVAMLGFRFHWTKEDRSEKGYKNLYKISLSKKLEIAKFLETITPCIKGGYK